VNDALNEAIFGGRFEGRPVYLTLGAIGRKIVAARTGLPMENLSDQVATSASSIFERKGNPYTPAVTMLKSWLERGALEPPPFTGALFCLAHAAELMDDSEDTTAGNYYDRLEQVVDQPRERFQKYTKEVVALWQGLNDWLERTGYSFGRPTAIPFDGAWVYVGYAMSQAVVRAADRKRFVQVFDRYGFVPGETLSERDITPYIETWLSTASAPGRLKRRWAQAMLRPRIAEAALDALREWDGQSTRTEKGQPPETRLSIAAVLAGFPLRFSLQLGLQRELATPIEGLKRVGGDPGESAFALSNTMSGEFASLSPSSAINASRVLRHGASFTAPEGNRYPYYPRDVIPFVQASTGGLWREVNRARFGERHLVLVRDDANTRSNVEAIIEEVAQASRCTVATSSDLVGLPAGWVLYRDVVIEKSAQGTYPDQVAVLDPLDDSSAIILEGGLRLGEGIWHSKVPPTARLVGPDGDMLLEVFPDIPGERSAPLQVARSSEAGCRLAIDPSKLVGASALSIAGKARGKRVPSQRLVLRSATQPRPPVLLDGRHGKSGYADVFSAGDLDGDRTEGIVATGFAVSRGEATGLSASLGTWTDLVFVAEPASDRDDEGVDALDSGVAATPVSAEASTRHVHVWQCETFDGMRSRTAPMFMECNACGSAMVARNRGRQRPRTRAAQSSIPVFRPTESRPTSLDSRSIDLALDGLCYLGRGSWARFDAIASTFTEEAFEVRQLAATLCELGFIDLELYPGSARVKSWSVCPPQLVTLADQAALLTGFRCESLVDGLRASVESLGGQLKSEPGLGQPSTVRVLGLAVPDLRGCVDGLRDPLGREVDVIEDAPRTILAACLGFPGLRSSLRPLQVGKVTGLQYFKPRTARWSHVERVSAPGAYRFEAHGRTYCLVDEDGQAYSGSYQLVKTIAVRQAGCRLHDYREDTRSFVSVPGAEPPALLARALAGCSGRRPIREGGFIVYTEVPADVAETTMDLLYSGDSEK
tara:strand:- start:12362 stop:15343 length:2982 start_codon:yes stop_codon:yes gene_type:complete